MCTRQAHTERRCFRCWACRRLEGPMSFSAGAYKQTFQPINREYSQQGIGLKSTTGCLRLSVPTVPGLTVKVIRVTNTFDDSSMDYEKSEHGHNGNGDNPGSGNSASKGIFRKQCRQFQVPIPAGKSLQRLLTRKMCCRWVISIFKGGGI